MMHRRDYDYPSSGTSKALGSSILAATLGAAITYFLYGTEHGAEKREQMKNYAYKMKDKMEEVSGTMGELKSLGKEVYGDMTSLFKEKYRDIKELNKEEMKDLTERIREHWDEMREEIEATLEKSRDRLGKEKGGSYAALEDE